MKNINILFAILPAVAMSLLLSGCATPPDKIEIAYVSPLKYEGHDCEQISAEQAEVERRLVDLYGRLKKKAEVDQAQVAGSFILWPFLLGLDGDGPDTNEYSRLKGEEQALSTAAIKKKCGRDSDS